MLKIKGNLNALLDVVSVDHALKIEENVDKELAAMTKEMSDKMAEDAPVKTGALRKSLIDGVDSPEKLTHQVKLDLENVPYTWLQNFEHRSKRYFITRNFNETESVFMQRLQKAVDET